MFEKLCTTESSGSWFECGYMGSKGYASLDQGQVPSFSCISWESTSGILVKGRGSWVRVWEESLEVRVLACGSNCDFDNSSDVLSPWFDGALYWSGSATSCSSSSFSSSFSPVISSSPYSSYSSPYPTSNYTSCNGTS